MFVGVVCTETGAGPTLGTIFGRTGITEVLNGCHSVDLPHYELLVDGREPFLKGS